MSIQKSKEKNENRSDDVNFKQIIKKELVRWYCNAMYSGKVKATNRSDRSGCSVKKA